jgi:hypothetical protein
MRRGSLFWGAILVILGILVLLDNLGILAGVSIWNIFWPLLLVFLGLSFLWGSIFGRRVSEAEQVSVPVDDIQQARLRLRYGAGRLTLSAGASPENLVEAACGGGIDYQTRREGSTMNVSLRMPSNRIWVFPWNWFPGQTDCTLRFSPDIPISFDINTGASDSRLDLGDLQVSDIRLQTGASSTYLALPKNAGHTRVDIESGVASLKVSVPQNVAARIQVKGGLSGINVDTQRFPRSGGVYQSVDYESAPDKADIYIETGVGSVDIR